ncbi:cAMP-activated global transcriptional regulator CRP [Spiribacter sp. 221]|uniref:cAMP-activated global transcriptional regulator CRP n=1 Tax=Spiribacter onubensis TaxID=3122420 RepID=UPI00349F657B
MSPESVRFFQRPAIVELLRHCRRSRYRARSTIVHQGTSGDRLYLILRGSVSVMEEDENGRELILAYLNPGDFIGEVGLFGDAPMRSAWIRTRNTCELAEISYERFARLQTAHPHILHPVVEQMTRRLRDTSRRFRDLAFEDVRGRVEATLRELAQQPDAMTHPEGMQLRITRIELGRLVGCSREMVGRVLRDMEADRLISARGRTIVVHEAR